MKTNIFTLFIIFICSSTILAQPSIDKTFDLNWKVKIGITTFRSNILFSDGALFVASNGTTRDAANDPLDGVYIINAKNGKTIEHIHPLLEQDEVEADVNGIALQEDKLFFGNDENQVYCYSTSGKQIWRHQLKKKFCNGCGDLEGCPVLFHANDDKFIDVVFNVEGYGLVAFNGENGDILWEFVKEGSYGSYMNSPAACDLNNDGVKDILTGGKGERTSTWDYGNWLFAVNGRNGELIWKHHVFSNIHASPVVIKRKQNVEIYCTECYSDITVLDKKGNVKKIMNFNEPDGGISGLFSTPVLAPNGRLIIGTSWWGDNDGIWVTTTSDEMFIRSETVYQLDKAVRKFTTTGKVSSSGFVADVLKKRELQLGICTEKGELLLYDLDGKLLQRLQLPAGVEATPFIGDIDNDNKLEIVIAMLDGFIYCYDTKAKAKDKNVFVGQFRNNNHNTGVIQMN